MWDVTTHIAYERRVRLLGLNGGSAVKHSEAFSFQVATDDQAAAQRAFDAMMQMTKIDIASIEAARTG